MQKLNLINQKDSDITYNIFHFPDGEVHIELGEINRKHSVKVLCRITNAEELFIVLQICDILDRQEVKYILCISYLMGMRMDRVMDFNRPFTLKLVCNLLNKSNAGNILVLDPHSDVYRFKGFDFLQDMYLIYKLLEDYQIIIPDEGAGNKYGYVSTVIPKIYCSKTRDVNTGQLTGFHIDNPQDIQKDRKLIIFDDLCDGGGTFCGLAEEFRKIYPNISISLSVVHAVNAKGIKKVCDVFDHVYITNSYADWDEKLKEAMPKNLTIRNILDIFD